jgi:hypothetical protein
MAWKDYKYDYISSTTEIYQEFERCGKITIPLCVGIWSKESPINLGLKQIEIYKAFYLNKVGNRMLIGSLQQCSVINNMKGVNDFIYFFDLKNLHFVREQKIKRLIEDGI